jgi:chorismate mutase/prephenate dehydrogenase
VSTEAKSRSLSALRGQIDALDRDILELLARRMAIVSELAGVKRDQGVRVRDARREQ